jgi:hypothetical protein
MKSAKIWIMLPAVWAIAAAQAQPAKVIKAARPQWALDPPDFRMDDPPKEALIQIRFFDNQVRVSKGGQENFIAQRFKILRPEALQAANLRFVWRPSSGQLTVHSIRLHRKDGSITEMLDKAVFQIVQREENLEQSVLTGLTTAVFAIPGVEVGDDVEFSATVKDRDPTLGDKSFGVLQLPLIDIIGTYRARLLLSDMVRLNRKATNDLDSPALTKINNDDELLITIDDPKSVNLPAGAPGRFGIKRLIEYSSFTGWPTVSNTFWKYFNQASKLDENSQIRSEIAKIAAASGDPEARALATLKFVQDRIRYVYVGFGVGNYTPATADQTWDRRYGDCKGKTALLLAMLRELGIRAEAVLVNQAGLDGISDRLASPGQFDHVLVRASIGDAAYWLDGTQFNSPKFVNMPQPIFRAALPLRENGAELEIVTARPMSSPAELEIVDIDASAGTDKPARISVRRILHGNEVTELRAGLSSLSGTDLKRVLRDALGFASGDAESEETSWAYNDNTGALSLQWAGTQKLDWQGKTPDGKFYYLPGAGFTPPNELKRPKEQDQSAPWMVDFPNYKCWVTTIKLPPDNGRLRWNYSAKQVDRILGGVRYFRQATIKKGTVQTIMSKRSQQGELSAEEAKIIEAGLKNFDAAKSYVYQTVVGRDAGDTDDANAVNDTASIDWLSAGQLCQPSKRK